MFHNNLFTHELFVTPPIHEGIADINDNKKIAVMEYQMHLDEN